MTIRLSAKIFGKCLNLRTTSKWSAKRQMAGGLLPWSQNFVLPEVILTVIGLLRIASQEGMSMRHKMNGRASLPPLQTVRQAGGGKQLFQPTQRNSKSQLPRKA